MSASGPRILHLTETGSTNADAMRLALAGEALPLWVVAESQMAGKGRAGRTWASKSGNLHASLALVSEAPAHQAGELALIAGIALYDAVRAISPLAETIGIRLKWPNDLLIGTAKAGGILVETTVARGEPGFLAVLGFGLNITSHPDDLGRAATSLAAKGVSTTAGDVLARLPLRFEDWLGQWDNGRNFAAIRDAWMARAGAIGEAITVQTVTGPMSGTYQGLDATGALLADISGRMRAITYGDVALIAPTHKGSGQ